MKSCVFFLLVSCSLIACGQTPSSSQTPPNQPASGSQSQQTPSQAAKSGTTPTASNNQSPANAPGQLKPRGPEAIAQQDPNRVVATIEGKPITAHQAVEMMKGIRPEDRKRFENNLSNLVQQLYMQRQFAASAVKMNLEQQSPWKEQLEMNRENVLAQAYISSLGNTAGAGAPTDDPRKYYDAHADEFEQVKLSGILVAFNNPGTPAANANVTRTEQQARDKANDLEKKIKGGSDFAALARSDSDDKRSAASGGEVGTFTLNAPNLPPDIKAAIAKLQPGQVSDPIRVPAGFYILKEDSKTKVPFEQARAQILEKWKNEKTQAALKQEFDKYQIQVKDPDFFNAPSSSASRIPSLQQGAAPTGGPPPTPPPSQASVKPQPQH